MAHDAFISYASEDRAVAEAVRAAVSASGLRPWMAPHDILPGQPFGEAIVNGIRECRTCILVYSASTNRSEHVPREMERAVHFGLPILPIRLDKSEPSTQLQHFIASVHWLDATNPPRKPELDRLTKAVKTWATKKGRIALLYKRNVQPDEELLSWLEKAFTERGYQVMVDRHLKIGVEWAKELERHIREADVVIPLLSAASIHSEMLAGELQLAQEESAKRPGKLRVLPVRVNFDGDLPPDLGGFLNRLQYFLWKGTEDNPRLLNELIETLQKPVEEPTVSGPPPTGVLPLDTRFYIERPADQVFLNAIRQRESVIRVRGARQVGKTSLLARGIHEARSTDAKVVFTDFQQLNASNLESVDTLFRTLGEWVAAKLKIKLDTDFWKRDSNPSVRFDEFITQEIMGRLKEEPLVWVMDEVDRLFACPFRSEVFGLFRSWHNARAMEPDAAYCRLTLVIAYATEAHLLIDNLDQSPFNVGTSISLDDFAVDQLAELNRRYGSPLGSDDDLKRFANLVGGHPFLANRGLYEMCRQGVDVKAFQKQAEREDGVFGDHLHRLLMLLSRDAELCEVVRGVLKEKPSASRESFFRLRSAGVLSGESIQEMRMRCQLYASYLKRHLL